MEVIKDLFLVEWYANTTAALDQQCTAVMQETQLPTGTAAGGYLVPTDLAAKAYVLHQTLLLLSQPLR